MAKFSETYGITCRKFVSKTDRSFSSVIEKCLKNAEFSGVLSPKVTLGATFNETRALTSVKYVAS